MNLSVIILSALVAIVTARPQKGWQNTRIDSFVPNQQIKLSKQYNFNKAGTNNLGGTLGYDRNGAGKGAGLFGSKSLGDSAAISGSVYKTQNHGTNYGMELSKTFGKTTLFGNHQQNDKFNFNQKTLGVNHNFGNGWSGTAQHTKNNLGGVKNSFGLTKTWKSGTSFSTNIGKSNTEGTFGGFNLNIPFGGKK